MVDERIASENHPSASNPEALNRQYSGPAVAHPGTPLAAPAFGPQLADTTNMSPEEARAEHGRLMRDGNFMARLSGNRASLDHLEKLSERMFGSPAGATQKDATAPQTGADGKPLSTEEQRAVDAMAAYRGELEDPEELAAFDAACEPKVPGEYHAIAGAEHKQILFQHGVAPHVANYVASQAETIMAMSDTEWTAATDKASDLVMKRPDGKAILADAQAYIDSLDDRHPLAKVAELAACSAIGIVELARLGRRVRTSI